MTSSIRNLPDPVQALPAIRESLVLSFLYAEEDRVFDLVCDYPEFPKRGDRSFAQCRFQDVAGFRRIPGSKDDYQKYLSSFQSGPDKPGFVIQSAPLEKDGSVNLWLGARFGGIAFMFSSLEIRLLAAYAVKRGDDFEYQDAVSGEKLDFYRPFRS